MIFKKIGISKTDKYWAALLDQLGLFWEEIHKPLEEYSLLIINDTPPKDITAYLKLNGAVIDTIGVISKDITKSSVQKSYVKSETIHYDSLVEQIDLYSSVKRVKGKVAEILSTQTGTLAFWGIPTSLLDDRRELRKSFNLSSSKLPAEEVSKVSKGTISRLFFDLLKKIFAKQKQPFIHKSFAPTNNSPLLFRIDTDWGTDESIKKWRTISQDVGLRTSWFLHVEAHEEWLDLFRSFPGDEIGLHCYSHIAKPKPSHIDNALLKIHKADLKPIGYSAPFGRFDEKINTHLIQRGFIYGSDFSYLYDSLPLQIGESLLQVPIFPVCMGSFDHTVNDAKSITMFFTDYINRQLYLHLPIILYDHPLHGNAKLMKEILRVAKNCGADPMSFEEFADFWIDRQKSRTSPEYSDLTLTNRCTVPLRVWSDEKHSFLLQAGESCHSEKTGTTLTPPRPQIPYKEQNRFSFRLMKNSFLHRYIWRKKR